MRIAATLDPAPLREAWQARRNLRIEGVLDTAFAAALEADLAGRPYQLRAAEPSRFNFQYWELDVAPCPACEHPVCMLGRWLWSDGAAWLSAITGMALGPPDDGHVVSTLYRKGCYLDPHSDGEDRRQLAFVLGLTRGPLPARAGGELEFLEVAGDTVRLAERRAPGWNTLDVFDVTAHRTVHQVALVTAACERRAVSGWFWRPE